MFPSLLDQSESVLHLSLVSDHLDLLLFRVSNGGGGSSRCKRMMHSHANQRNRQWRYEDIAALADSGTYCLPLHQTPATVRDRQVDITKQQVSTVAIFLNPNRTR
jgi:hypothetical protein